MSESAAAERPGQAAGHGEFCWTEIATDNAEACRTFFAQIFGWQFNRSDATGGEIEYLEFGTDGENRSGAIFQMNPAWYGGEMSRPHLNNYVAVSDVDAAASRAVELGGKIVGEPMDVPNVGRIAEIEDPAGARLFIIKLND